MSEEGCRERLGSRGRWDYGTRYCGKPVVATIDGSPVCKFHKTVDDKRRARGQEKQSREDAAKVRAQRIGAALGIDTQVYRDHTFEVTDKLIVPAADLEALASAVPPKEEKQP